MAKKKTSVILENVELKPQVIGNVYQKKSNIGRVLFVFIAIGLVIFYIDEISLFINSMLGMETSSSIRNNNTNDNKKDDNTNEEDNEEINYYTISDDLSIVVDDITFNNFKYDGSKITFDALNDTSNPINVSNQRYYLETYLEDKTLVDRFKLDINTILSKSKVSFNLNTTKLFAQIVVREISIDEYPLYELSNDSDSVGMLVCRKNNETIEYAFNQLKLQSIKHTIVDNNISDLDYLNRLATYQNKKNSYSNLEGIQVDINSNESGYTATFVIDANSTSLNEINEKYYYKSNEENTPTVIYFEMTYSGFSCN